MQTTEGFRIAPVSANGPSMLSRDKLDELRSLLAHFEDRRARAQERLAAQSGQNWCFAILGLKTDIEEYDFGSIVSLRPVKEPPGEVELAHALKDRSLFSAIGRYSHLIEHEITVDNSFGDEKGAFNLAWWVVSALRVKTLADVLIPAVADKSWSVVAGLPQGSCHVQLLEDVPRAHRFAPDVSVTRNDFDWVFNNIVAFVHCLEIPKFRLAVEALTTHQQHADMRMTTASLWAGIKALFSVNTELRFRLAAYIAAYLRESGSHRLSKFHQLCKLYDFRSKAVHGSSLTEEELFAHILSARSVLSSLICKMITEHHVPTKEDYERYLFENSA